jgi:hypothetical protein
VLGALPMEDATRVAARAWWLSRLVSYNFSLRSFGVLEDGKKLGE